MTLETASLDLVDSLRALRESLADLLRLITEDRPYEHSLAHRYEHGASEVLGRLEAALYATVGLQQVAGHYDNGQAFGALVSCQAEFNRAAEKYHTELNSFDWLQDLQALGHDHPEAWAGWVDSIKSTLEQCDLFTVQDALLRCWQSLLISSGALSTRYFMNIDRQTVTPQDEHTSAGPGQ